ncbi:50S ribosomal protein L13 [Candidatus Uhrbacteria bacterium]|nr:50S ribosomal protein L13 [Candidatus Uhrbacteria bacterium]
MPTRTLHRDRHELDAEGQSVGRLATRIATLLRGKHKPSFRVHLDEGDMVVVKNISKASIKGSKLATKVYYHYSGYLGGMKERKLNEIWSKDPAWVLKHAVMGMLPENRLRIGMMKRLIIE